MDIHFTPIYPLKTQKNGETPNRHCTTWIDRCCTSIGYLQQRRKFKSRGPKLGSPTRIDRRAICSTLTVSLLNPKERWYTYYVINNLHGRTVHCYSLSCLLQSRKFQNDSPKVGVANTDNDDMDITFTPILPRENPKNRGTSSRPCSTCIDVYCTSLGYLQHRRKFKSRDPKVGTATHVLTVGLSVQPP